MNCPNCNHICGENDFFCTQCGTRLNDQAPPPPEYTPPAKKKGAHWVPILLLVLMAAIGIGVYFATGAGSSNPETMYQASSIPWFMIQDGTLYFDADRYNGPSELTIPSVIDGEPVLEIAPGCFENCTELTEITLPDTLTIIGSEAFMGCTNMRGISIPESVVSIGDAAFLNCSELEAISIPGSVTSIGYQVFSGCDNLWYIFYDGNHGDWVELCDDFITPYTGVFCKDGSFYQGSSPNE